MAKRIEPERCTSCGECLPECPNEGIVEIDGVYIIQQGYCTECYGVSTTPQCEDACVFGAIEDDPEWPETELALAGRAADLTPSRFPRD